MMPGLFSRMLLCSISFCALGRAFAEDAVPPLPKGARLVLEEDWSTGAIDPRRWYVPRRLWGGGNHGVVPENVWIARDEVAGESRNVLVCRATGDAYDGPVVGAHGRKTRVGGIVVSKEFFASGRFETVLKIGSRSASKGGPADPLRPKGAVPAIWTYAYRFVSVPRDAMHEFTPATPLYNPHMRAYGTGANEYWSEIDFPEFGKNGDFDRAMYNTFLQNQHDSRFFDVSAAIDGRYHTLTTDWRTELLPLDGVTDAQVVEHEGYWWVQDKTVPFDRYFGNPLKRLGKDKYAVYAGVKAEHWIDGKRVGENTRVVPSMAAQLTLGVWLPDWGGPAPWSTATVSFASARVWQYDDPGDARGILRKDIPDNFDANGKLRQ